LFQELREEFDKFGWLLTAPLGVIPDTIEHSFDIPAISKYLDYMFALCYSYHGHWDSQTGPDAPLYPLYQDDEYNVVCIHLVYVMLVLLKLVCKPDFHIDQSYFK
jgi:chitinase